MIIDHTKNTQQKQYVCFVRL